MRGSPAGAAAVTYYIRRPGAHATFCGSPEGTPGIERDAVVRINALGLRGPMPSPDDRIKLLVIGGSTVEDMLLNDEDTWCGRLAEYLGPHAWIGNMGRSGTNARHHAIQLEHTRDYLPKPDATLILCGLNDMLADIGAHAAEREPTMAGCFGAGPGIGGDFEDGLTFDLGADFAHYKRCRRNVMPECWITEPPADFERSLFAYAESLVRLADVAVAPVFLTQPTLWAAEMTAAELAHCYAGGIGSPAVWDRPGTHWYRHDALAKMMACYNAVMHEACALAGAPCIDLAAGLSRDTANYYDDFHFTAVGAARVARCVAREMRAWGAVPEFAA